MGLFGKRNRKKLDTAEQQTRNTVQQSEELADVLYVYLQKEGFFPERGTTEDTDAHREYIYFKFQGFNVTMEISQNDYLRLIVVLEIDPDGSDCFNLMMAAFRTMYEMKAVKIVLGVKWIQFSVETFVASADAFTPFLMRYLDILTDRHLRYAQVVGHIGAGFHDEVLRLAYIVQVAVGGMFKPPQVVEGMVADAMSAFQHLAEHVGIFADVVAHHEEGGFHAVMVQLLEHPGGHFGDGTVIEGQVDFLFRRCHPPQGARIELADKFRGLFNKHGTAAGLMWLVKDRITTERGNSQRKESVSK